MLGQQGDQFLKENFIALAGLIEKGLSIGGFPLQSGLEQFLDALELVRNHDDISRLSQA
jgi:hypothetical protein